MRSTPMVRLTDIPIEPEVVVNFLKREVHLKEVYQKILSRQIISRAAQEHHIIVTPEEIQAVADQQRYQRRLESASATYAWLEDQLITATDWEAGIYDELLTHKLASTLFANQVEKFFAEHRLDFEQVSLYKIMVPYQPLAQELFYQIEEKEISFYEAAHLYDVDERRRLQCGFEGKVYRWSLKPDITAIIFNAELGKVMGPFPSAQGYDLLMVEEFVPPELNPTTRQEIIDQMFDEWLESELNYFVHSH